MENSIAVSIIVPAYNAAKSLRNCVESILSQTLKNIEVIAVDDGSNDDTRKILRVLADTDPRVIVVEKDKNEGLSAARNSGIEVAKGEYIGFVDADDWVENDAFENMYTNGKHADLVLAGYRHDSMDEARTRVNVSRKICMRPGYWEDKQQIVMQAAYADTSKMFAYTWNKLYKRDIILNCQMQFSKEVLIEDFVFNTKYWDQVSTLAIVDCTKYHYVKASKEALTQKFLPDFFAIMNSRFDAIKGLMSKNGVYSGEIRQQLANMYIKHAIAGVVRNFSPKANYSLGEQRNRIKELLADSHSKEAQKNAKGNNKQEKLCNFVFKSKSAFLVFLLGKVIFWMQTKSKTAFDKLK
nr:glycosyltransferase family 2 protein [uncultured Mediterraneibacter sp.]